MIKHDTDNTPVFMLCTKQNFLLNSKSTQILFIVKKNLHCLHTTKTYSKVRFFESLLNLTQWSTEDNVTTDLHFNAGAKESLDITNDQNL